jgi:Ca2+-binding EF-hand superfamily protein
MILNGNFCQRMAESEDDLSADENYRKIFDQLDRDHDGKIVQKEFQSFMRKNGALKIAPALFGVLDRDHNGWISLNEFLAFGRTLWAEDNRQDRRPKLQFLFHACDAGSKGYLTNKEFQKFMVCTGTNIPFWRQDELFKAVDRDRSGTIEFEEVLEVLMSEEEEQQEETDE